MGAKTSLLIRSLTNTCYHTANTPRTWLKTAYNRLKNENISNHVRQKPNNLKFSQHNNEDCLSISCNFFSSCSHFQSFSQPCTGETHVKRRLAQAWLLRICKIRLLGERPTFKQHVHVHYSSSMTVPSEDLWERPVRAFCSPQPNIQALFKVTTDIHKK